MVRPAAGTGISRFSVTVSSTIGRTVTCIRMLQAEVGVAGKVTVIFGVVSSEPSPKQVT